MKKLFTGSNAALAAATAGFGLTIVTAVLTVWWVPADYVMRIGQLPAALIAGTAAVLTSAIAYRGAIAKVRHDRDVRREEAQRRQINLYMQADRRMEWLRDEIMNRAAPWAFYVESQPLPPPAWSNIELPSEIAQIWDHVADFPPEARAEFIRVSKSLDRLRQNWPDEKPLHPEHRELLLDGLLAAADACALFRSALEPVIRSAWREYSDKERMLRLYGEPD